HEPHHEVEDQAAEDEQPPRRTAEDLERLEHDPERHRNAELSLAHLAAMGGKCGECDDLAVEGLLQAERVPGQLALLAETGDAVAAALRQLEPLALVEEDALRSISGRLFGKSGRTESP